MTPEYDGGVYLPSDDTQLLIRVVSSESGERCLEIGFGSGVVLSTLSERFVMAVGTEVMPLSMAKEHRPSGGQIVLADGASCFRDGAFDLVAFNPPYLPSEGIRDRTVDGGRGGIEVPIRLLGEALRVVRPGGKVLVVLSDADDLEGFRSTANGAGASVVEKLRKKLFYETLVVYEVSPRASSGRA